MEIMERALLVVERAKKMVITNDTQMTEARNELVYIADMKKEIHSTFDPINQKNHVAWKEGLAQMQKHLKPLEASKMIINPVMATYLEEKERVRLAAEKEQQKKEAAAAVAANKLLEDAMAAEEKGDTEKAGELMDKMEEVTAEVETTAVAKKEKLDGVHTRVDVLWREIDLNKVPRYYLMLDERKLNQCAKQMGMESRVPGIQFYTKTTVVTKATKKE